MAEEIYQQNRVSSIVWHWQKEGGVAPAMSTRKAEITKGFVGMTIGYSIAAFFYFKMHHTRMPVVIVSISTIISFCAFFIPAAFHKIEAGFNKFAHVVGVGLAYILLVPLFYTFFVGAHACMAMMGIDKLKLKKPTDETSFWEKRDKITDKSYYRKQF
ncbi:MAG: hypothetical protein ACI9TH_000796 [Kiritimatiellia bacterium]|jgi:hypothetical protein